MGIGRGIGRGYGIGRDREGLRDRDREGRDREGIRDREYGVVQGVVQGVWLRAGLGVDRDWGTGGLG